MQTPQRKPRKIKPCHLDRNITQKKYDHLKAKLEKSIKIIRPKMITNMQRLAEMGDFSENAGYQIAKWRLRALNYRIVEMENSLKEAIIINTNTNNDEIQLGSTVILSLNNKEITFQILGSSETNPDKNIISHKSPLGSALLGKSVGDEIELIVAENIVKYKIVNIK